MKSVCTLPYSHRLMFLNDDDGDDDDEIVWRAPPGEKTTGWSVMKVR